MEAYTRQYIEQLLAKFLEGDTSLKEEKLLSEYFATAKHIPKEWQCYKEMFAYFRRGMTDSKPSVHLPRLRIAAVAASITLLLGIGIATLHYSRPQEQQLAKVETVAKPSIKAVEKPIATKPEAAIAQAKEHRKASPRKPAKAETAISRPAESTSPSTEKAAEEAELAAMREALEYQLLYEALTSASQDTGYDDIEDELAASGQWLVFLPQEPSDTTKNNEKKTIYL